MIYTTKINKTKYKMKSRLEKVYSKLPNQKVNLKAQKVMLGLIDEFEYTSEYTNEVVGRMDYTTDTWFDEKFNQMFRRCWQLGETSDLC